MPELPRTRSPLFLAGLALLLGAAPASATILGGEVTGGGSLNQGGVFVKLTVPFSESNPTNTVGRNNFQNPNLYAFDEDQNIRLDAPLDVDILATTGEAGTLPVGTVVASHYVFFDPQAGRTQTGTITFDSDVLAILRRTATLNASDFLANTGVNYLDPNLRGLEGRDLVTITSAREIAVDWFASTPGDYVRVLTTFSPLPEPGPMALLASLGAALAWARRRP